MDHKICTQCGQDLPISSFYSNGKGGYRSECKTCHAAYVAKRYTMRRQYVDQLKADHGCQKCGDRRPYVLDFHHKDAKTKAYTVARTVSNCNNFDTIKREIEKCVVLCANCHREYHHFFETSQITLEEYLSL